MLRSMLVAAGLFIATPALACPMADAAAFAEAAKAVQEAAGTKVSIAVQGMHCGDCSSKVTAALQGVDGVEAVAVDYQTGAAEIAYDADKVSVDTLVKAITDTGFEAALKPKA